MPGKSFNQIMKSRPPWYYKQSAVIPYRMNGESCEVLLITSRKKQNWILPKGIIEIGMSAEESASKEAMEEAGVVGLVGDELIGEYKYEKWGGLCRVKVFPLLVKKILEKWPEDNIRQRKWFAIDKAIKKLNQDDMMKIVINFRENYFKPPRIPKADT